MTFQNLHHPTYYIIFIIYIHVYLIYLMAEKWTYFRRSVLYRKNIIDAYRSKGINVILSANLYNTSIYYIAAYNRTFFQWSKFDEKMLSKNTVGLTEIFSTAIFNAGTSNEKTRA